MTSITLDLPPDLYERLHAAAAQQHKPVDTIVRDWLEERLPPDPSPDDRRATLRNAGLLVDFDPEDLARAMEATVTLEEVSSTLERAGGRPLSEIVIEQRGPKV